MLFFVNVIFCVCHFLWVSLTKSNSRFAPIKPPNQTKNPIPQRMHPGPPQNQLESKDEAIRKISSTFFMVLKDKKLSEFVWKVSDRKSDKNL